MRCLGQILRGWQDKGDYTRLKVMELLWVKGWANRDVAAFLGISEQQVANFRFAAVKKLTELIRAAGLSADVFPELQAEARGVGGPCKRVVSIPVRSRTSPSTFAGSRAAGTPRGYSFVRAVPRPGVEPGPRPSEGRVIVRFTTRAKASGQGGS